MTEAVKKTGGAKQKAAKPKTAKPKAAKPQAAKAKAVAKQTPAKPKATAKPKTGAKSAKAGTAKRKAPTSARAKATTKATKSKASAKPSSAPKRTAKVEANPVATSRHAYEGKAAPRKRRDDLFLEERPRKAKSSRKGGRPPLRHAALFGTLNACLVVGIVVLIALGVRQERGYAEFSEMREVVDRQTFYAGTTVEGVDVSSMTLSNAMDYWRDKVEARYANRTVTLDNGETVTAGDLGYRSDYASVLTAAWSAGRNGGLEDRYRMVSSRSQNPVAYSVTRSDYDPQALEQYVSSVADAVDQTAVDAAIESFNAETYEFTFAEAREGRRLDRDALKRDIAKAIAAGGGNVALNVETIEPTFSTEAVASQYGLIDYAITNASSSSKARLNNIKLAMSFINGTRVAPGETFSFNEAVGERTTARGFRKATAYSGGDVTEQVGGGICQVSTTLFNAAVKAGMEIVERHNHSLTVAYVDKGKDATVDWGHQDFKFKNTSPDAVYICCYLTDDKRVRFGIFGLLLPGGEKITLDAVTTEVVKYDTVYEASPLLAHGQTQVQTAGRNGYKAEAYKVRWDAEGNELSRELLCKSYYKMKSEVVLYGA